MLKADKALIEGLIFAIAMCGWIAVILKVNPRYEMKSYPKEILDTIPAQTKEEKKGFMRMALPALLLFFAIVIICMQSDYAGTDASFITLLLHAFIVLQIWNLFDLFVFDWIIFCTVNPKFMIIPGTEGNPGYKNYRYHFEGFLKGLLITATGALLIAGIVFMLVSA